MKILIGTPIHQVKDYAMERWLENVAKLQQEYPADLFMVDNSPSSGYLAKVKNYCAKLGIDNYTLEHFDIDQDLGPNIRIERSQEIIRRKVLSRDYDAWFSWECDQIIPPTALKQLVDLMKTENYLMVVHDAAARWDVTVANANMGITLISREALQKTRFLPERNGQISLDPKDSYDVNDPTVFKKRVLQSGGSYIDVYGVISPIYHLDR